MIVCWIIQENEASDSPAETAMINGNPGPVQTLSSNTEIQKQNVFRHR